MDAETATVLRGRAKAALTRTKNFIDKDDQNFDKNDIRNKLEKLELTYTEFDKADAALPIEFSEMEEFETKYYETKAKLQNILENSSVKTYVYNDNSDVFENVSNMKSSNFKLPKINIEHFSAARGLLATDHVILNHGQVTWTTPELAPPHLTTTCNSEGRFVVKLPFYKSNSELGDSIPAAISRLLAMERKFKNNPDFEKQYKEFMNEYESLGHMSLVNSRFHTSKDQNFLPHHAVIKPSSTTTKLKVVFDASFKTTNGTSLNSLLGVGPKLQRDIFEILLNF
ncbi:uncharacterized protein TNCV_4369751 [Trichonephila clavipes]|nr:uncharacterized protein TNCV_4369751 [Trichonephila clavipes]